MIGKNVIGLLSGLVGERRKREDRRDFGEGPGKAQAGRQFKDGIDPVNEKHLDGA